MLSPPRSPYTLSDRCRVMAHQLGSVAVQTHSVSPALSDFAPLHSPPPASPSSGFRALLAEEHSAGDGNTLGLSMSYDSPLSPSPSAEFGSALMEIDESEEEDEGDAVSKDGARTPVYRSSAEPLEGFVLKEALAHQGIQEMGSEIRRKLEQALREYSEPITVQVCLVDGELLISKDGRALSPALTLTNTYLDPLISILEPSSAVDEESGDRFLPHPSHRRSSSGLFISSNQPTLPLVIDLHPHDSQEAFEYLRHALQSLRDLSLLTEYSPAADLVTRAPVTIFISDAPSTMLSEEMGERWIFRPDDEKIKSPRKESHSPTDSGYSSSHRASEVEQTLKTAGIEAGQAGERNSSIAS